MNKNTRKTKEIDEYIKVKNLKSDVAILYIKEEMNVVEILKLSNKLKEITEKLICNVSAYCKVCEGCASCKEIDDLLNIKVPECLKEEAGIPKNAKFWAYTEENSGEIIVEMSENEHDITDIPKWIKNAIKSLKRCMCDLNELISNDEKINVIL